MAASISGRLLLLVSCSTVSSISLGNRVIVRMSSLVNSKPSTTLFRLFTLLLLATIYCSRLAFPAAAWSRVRGSCNDLNRQFRGAFRSRESIGFLYTKASCLVCCSGLRPMALTLSRNALACGPGVNDSLIVQALRPCIPVTNLPAV